VGAQLLVGAVVRPLDLQPNPGSRKCTALAQVRFSSLGRAIQGCDQVALSEPLAGDDVEIHIVAHWTFARCLELLLEALLVKLVMCNNADGRRRLDPGLIFGIGIVDFFWAAVPFQDLVFGVRMVDLFWAALLPQVFGVQMVGSF
jgi:hypothetical protein